MIHSSDREFIEGYKVYFRMIHSSDREFIEGYKVYFEQAKLGFIHGMQPATMSGFENIYRTYLDKNFNLTVWCSACVVDMMQRLSQWWEGIQQEEEAAAIALQAGQDTIAAISAPLAAEEPIAEERPAWKDNRPKSRRGRPKKDA